MATRSLTLLCSIALVGCGAMGAAGIAAPKGARAAASPAAARDSRLAAIEKASGGRLGVALLDREGRLLLGNRVNERFAMCSTFKLPLAAMVLDGASKRRWALGERLRFGRGDLVGNSPSSKAALGQGYLTVEKAAEAIVTTSDNTAANLLLRRTGGAAALTGWIRRTGDPATRLDRFEPAMNENALADPRDTTTPLAMAGLTRRLALGGRLPKAEQARLRQWMIGARTGQRRIKAGLPKGWTLGHKTGTCGTAYNDVAWLRSPSGSDYLLAVYLDRPTVAGPQADAAIADVARLAVARAR